MFVISLSLDIKLLYWILQEREGEKEGKEGNKEKKEKSLH